jgi:hypothetical protein
MQQQQQLYHAAIIRTQTYRLSVVNFSAITSHQPLIYSLTYAVAAEMHTQHAQLSLINLPAQLVPLHSALTGSCSEAQLQQCAAHKLNTT